MYSLLTKTVHLLPISSDDEQETTLNRIVEDVYGYTYDGLQANDNLHDYTDYIIDLVTDEDINRWAMQTTREEFTGKSTHTRLIDQWIEEFETGERDEGEDSYGAPFSETMLATLVLDGHLPRGTYALRVM